MNSMLEPFLKKANEGRVFQLGDDVLTIKVSEQDTGGAYSVIFWQVSGDAVAPPHAHQEYDEFFYIISGSLDFMMKGENTTISAGDILKVPAGTRHGYANVSGEPTEMLVCFTPGGMEELFYKYRTDNGALDMEGFLSDAKQFHQTEYELKNTKYVMNE